MTHIVKTSERGQVTIPQKIREQFATVHFKVETIGNKIELTPLFEEESITDQETKDLDKAYKEYKEQGGISLDEMVALSHLKA